MGVWWLTRSLLFIVTGAVLAYAVTARYDAIDIPTTGVILLLVGIFDLLVNVAVSYYVGDPFWSNRADRYAWEDRVYPPGRQHLR